jgi:hypothetical protein
MCFFFLHHIIYMSETTFNQHHFESNDGMMTSIWGPPLWHTLHTISFNYPVHPTPEDKEKYYDFFASTFRVLPCKFCRENIIKNMNNKKLPRSVFKNRETLSRWLYNIHEKVNEQLNKSSGLSYEDVRERFEGFRSRCLYESASDAKQQTKVEKGCTESLYGMKGKTILCIVPKQSKKDSFTIDKKCIIKKTKNF